jgi:hypothetical protein
VFAVVDDKCDDVSVEQCGGRRQRILAGLFARAKRGEDRGVDERGVLDASEVDEDDLGVVLALDARGDLDREPRLRRAR